MKLRVATMAALTLACLGFGCTSSQDGMFVQTWTIQGGTSATSCTVTGATQMRTIIINGGGGVEATNFVACNAFQSSFVLAPGTYTAAATFIGANGLEISKTKLVPPFNITENITTGSTVDFALTDFQAPP
jgi:hypothetical protein